MMNSVHFMLLNRELELNEIIEKLTPSVSLEDNMLLHAAETELSEIKMTQQILNDYEAEQFLIANKDETSFLDVLKQKPNPIDLPEIPINVGKHQRYPNQSPNKSINSTHYRKTSHSSS